ncbi:MAG: hypothetical protein HZA53_13200 [Planctomycetes bacterium]|nr:hypothetical protein [Planctomycetota bacterium]
MGRALRGFTVLALVAGFVVAWSWSRRASRAEEAAAGAQSEVVTPEVGDVESRSTATASRDPAEHQRVAEASVAAESRPPPDPPRAARTGGAVHGSYRFDVGVPVDALSVRLVDSEQPEPRTARRTAPLREDGSWNVEGCPRGRFDLELVLEHAPRAVHVVLDVRVEDGQDVRDARLVDVDLRGVLRACALEVVDANGAPVKEGIASFYALDGKRQSSVVVRDGRARALLVGPPLVLDVAAAGHRAFVLEGVDGDRRVELRGSLSARFALARDARLPREPWQLQCELEPVFDAANGLGAAARSILERRLGAIDELAFSIDPTNRGGVELALPYPGRYRVLLRVQDVGTGREEPLGAPAQELDVRDVTVLQPFELALDPAALDAACMRLAQPR